MDNGVTVRAVQKAITADSENPATFTFDNTGWIAMTIAVRPEAETTPVANWELKNCAWLGYYSSLSTPVWVRPEGAANDMNVPPGGAALLACGIAVNLEDAEQTTIEWVTTKNGGGQAQITNNPAANGIGWGGNAFTILNGQSIESPLPDLTISPYSFITGAVRGSVEFNPSISLLTNTLTQFILILQIHRTAAVPTDRFCFIPKRPNNVDISLAIAAPCLEVANPGTIR